MKRYVSLQDLNRWMANGAPPDCNLSNVHSEIAERFGPGLYSNEGGWHKIDILKPTREDLKQLEEKVSELHTVVNYVADVVLSAPEKNYDWLLFQKEIGANAAVSKFIDNFRTELGRDRVDDLIYFYTHGWCYYFACTLREAFDRGCVAKVHGASHIVWVDDDGTAYDINGKRRNDLEYYEHYVDRDAYRNIPEDTWETLDI